MARTYEVEGTKNFLYWAIGLAVLALWCMLDGWFPRESVMLKHPDFPESVGKILFNKDHFYDFNRFTAILTALGAVVCGYIHKVVK